MVERIYPVGIQKFSDIIKKECVYVDKTDLIYKVDQEVQIRISQSSPPVRKILAENNPPFLFRRRKRLHGFFRG